MSKSVAVYGTLRKGYGLNGYLSDESATFIGEAEINGFKMFSFYPDHISYPIVAKSDNLSDKIVVELYEFHDTLSGKSAENRIDRIEYGAGYHSELIEVNGKKYKIYLQNLSECEKYLSHIESGDYNEFVNRLKNGRKQN